MKVFQFLRKPMSLTVFAGLMSLGNLVFYNIPFFNFVLEHANHSFLTKSFLMISLVIIMLVLNFMMCYLLIYLLRYVGRIILAICSILSATCTFFVINYHVLIDRSMLGNVFNTRESEASGFITPTLFLYVLFFGVLPAIYILAQKIDRGKLKRLGIACGSSLGMAVVLVLLNLNQVLWIGKYDTELGALVMPYSYIVNTIRWFSAKADANKEEILLPKGTFEDNEKTVVVLVIGESARKANFQLYGYDVPTNPELSRRNDLTVFNAQSCFTYTTAGTKSILEYKETSKLYEILPNYLNRMGAEVVWRTSNWGEPPVHIKEYKTKHDLQKEHPHIPAHYDEILTAGLRDRILASKKNKVFIVLHTSTSHGPNYNTKYPKEFEKFAPVCTNVEHAKDSIPELINAYNNTILYTDHLLNGLIDTLSTLEGWHSAMMFVSDHGESLGENDLYMHGLPMSMAPKEQYEIPFFVWTSPGFRQLKPKKELIDQHYVFHSVLNLLSVKSPIYDGEHDLFINKKK